MNKYKKNNKGFSTIELLIAFAILIINITGILLLTSGSQGSGTGAVIGQGQKVSISSETNQEALYKAQKQMEEKRADAKNNFFSIESVPLAPDPDEPLYSRELKVTDISPCLKQVTSSLSWNSSKLPIELSTLITDIAGALALGGDCDSSPIGGDDWKKPVDLNYSGVSLKTEGRGKAVDARKNFAYLVTKAAGNNKDDFFIFDTTDIDNPIKRGHLDISDGLEDIDVKEGYAFIANDENINTDQLKVVDISNIDAPAVVASVSLPNIVGSCPNTCPGGRSIYFYNNRIYIGTHRLVAPGSAEFHVLDVANPISPAWLGSKGGTYLGDPVDHNINNIMIREENINGTIGTYAYLATSNNSGELIILNVTNPNNIPNPTGTLNSGSILNLPGTGTGEGLDATSLYVIGTRAYIGRERATGSNNDFFIVDISNPALPTIIGSLKLNLNSSGSSVVGIRVVSNLALITTTDPNMPFIVLDISNPSLITRWDNVSCGINFSTYPTGIDYENNLIYIPLHNASSNVNLKIIKPTGGSC